MRHPCVCVCVCVFSVFSGMNPPKTSAPQQSWPTPEYTPVPSSIWDIPGSDSLHSWPSSSSSPTAPTAVRPSVSIQHFSPTNLSPAAIVNAFCCCFQSLLGNGRNPWGTTTTFGSSIWSTDSALHSFAPTTSSTTLTDLVNSPTPTTPASAERRPYNPWSMWGPTLSRRSSDPWPSSSENGN